MSKELNIPYSDIEACVVGSHGEGMLPLPRFSNIKGAPIDRAIDDKKIEALVNKTKDRGAQIISLLGNASAYFAPSAAITEIVKSIAQDAKHIIGICVYLDGEYGIRDVCIGVPCRLGKTGIEDIIELGLNAQEKELFLKSAHKLKEQYKNITL